MVGKQPVGWPVAGSQWPMAGGRKSMAGGRWPNSKADLSSQGRPHMGGLEGPIWTYSHKGGYTWLSLIREGSPFGL